ncbi:MAG: hypothetical protein J0H08_04480, partial [Rhizobiales bacterium]|nr:hypothetical protein [Hyphomicrobiales bacterium]
VALLQLPLAAFPTECLKHTPYRAIMRLGSGAATVELKILFETKPATKSLGYLDLPASAWAVALDVAEVSDVEDRTYTVEDVRDATPDEVAEAKRRLSGRQ